MKRVININFQGTIIPIEESAYEILQKYSESLRRHFANEEGRDEIINDIETRISELFSESLKKGATCITDDEVNAVINSMGRPEDFDADIDISSNTESKSTQSPASATADNTSNASNTNTQSNTTTRKQLFRDENHKVLGGVCSGVANYFNMDPVVMRIIALIFFSVTFIPYIVIWLVVPSSATKVIGSPRKRLFRDTDNKRIAGVCSGLAQYFGMNTKLVRIIFLIPFISIALREQHWFGWGFPHFLSLSFSPAATIAYLILWILVPEAKTTSDKLEMKGKPVDLNSIKDTVQNDLNEFKDKAQKWTKDVSGTAQKWSSNISNAAQNLGRKNDESSSSNSDSSAHANAPETTTTPDNFTNTQHQYANVPAKKERRSGVPLILKILAYIVLGLIITPIIVSLFGVGIGFMAVLPASDYVLKSGWENILSWGTFFLFIWVPIIGIILWFFRLITRSRKGSAAIRGSFIGLWILGWICFFGLLSMMGRDFSHSAYTPTTSFDYKDKGVKTMVVSSFPQDEFSNWNEGDFSDFIRYFGNDSVKIPNVALSIKQSTDENYHVEGIAYSNGSNREEAVNLASKIGYNFNQKDSVLFIPSEFFINKNDKFRNQRIFIKIAVPIGKRIIVKGNSHIHRSIDINFGPFGAQRNNWDNADMNWEYDVLYTMTVEGLKPVDDPNKKEDSNQTDKKQSTDNKTQPQSDKTNADQGSKSNDESDNQSTKDNKTTIKTTSTRKFTFYSMASLLSNKFAL